MRKNRYTILLLQLAIILVCYSSVFLNRYIFLDDYYFFDQINSRPFAEHFKNLMLLFTSIGRPVKGSLIEAAFSLSGHIATLRFLRLFALFGLSFFAWRLYCELMLLRWSRALSFWTAVAVVTLPSFQVYAFWTQYFSIPFALLLAFLSGSMAWRSFPAKGRLFSVKLLALAFLFESISMMIYQPAAMIFWLYPCIALVGFVPNNFRTAMTDNVLFVRLSICLGMVGTASLLDFIVIRVPLFLGMRKTVDSRTAFVKDLYGKLEWFVGTVLNDVLNFWNFSPNHNVSVAVAAVTLAVLVGTFYFQRKSIIIYTSAITGVVLLSYLPNLVITENWSSYRTQPAIAACLLLIVISGVRNCLMVFKPAQLLLAPRLRRIAVTVSVTVVGAVACFSAYYATSNFCVKPQLQEIELMKRELATIKQNEVGKICIEMADWRDSLSRIVRYEEIGFPSSAAVWVPVPMVRTILHELQWEYAKLPQIYLADKCKPQDRNNQKVFWLNMSRALKSEKK